MRQVIIAVLILSSIVVANGQNERKFVRKGNNYFMDGVKDTMKIDTIRFQKAEAEYRKALEKKQHDPKWSFNLGDAQYKQMRFDEAISNFDQIAQQSTDPLEKARAHHNIGNSLLFSKKLDESIESYKEALRNNPNDIETKYNLAYAQRMKQQQQQQQNQDNKNQDQQQNQDKQDQNKDQQNNQQNQDKNQQQQQQQPQSKISKENAEQLLQALQNDEQKIQDKVKKAKVVNAKKVKVEKDW